jgi:hypothetical protein
MAELRPIIHADFFQDKMLVLSIRLLSLLVPTSSSTTYTAAPPRWCQQHAVVLVLEYY